MNTAMNLLIVDDEAAGRAALIELCRRSSGLSVVAEVDSGAQAIEAAKALRPDLVFLDSQMPDMTGLEVLRALPMRQQRRTVLVAASTEDAETGFAVGALDCLIKPVSSEAFSTTILRARERFRSRAGRARELLRESAATPLQIARANPLLLIGEREHRLHPLDPGKIDYIESVGNYVKYVSGNVEYIARESVKQLDVLLCPIGFVRIERSLLLNVHSISYVQPVGHGTFAFTLTSGARMRSGPAYRDTILGVLPLRRTGSRGGKRHHPLCEDLATPTPTPK